MTQETYSQRIKELEKEIDCLNCNKRFIGKNKKFCSIDCRTRYNAKKYYLRHKEQEKERLKVWISKNREKFREHNHKYLNSEKGKAKRKEQYLRNKLQGKVKEWSKTFYKKHGSKYYVNKQSPFYKKVVLETNHKFKKDPICAMPYCNNKSNLQFHHWIYKLPVERKHFSTLCRECHRMVHGRYFNG